MTPTITEDTPTEPTTPRSLKPRELDPVLLLAEELKELREEQSRTNKAQEKKLEQIAAQHKAEGEARRKDREANDEAHGHLASGLRTLGQAVYDMRTEMRDGIQGLKAESDEHRANLIKVDVARATHDSLTDERLSVTEADVDLTQAKVDETQADAKKTKTEIEQVKKRLTAREIATYAVGVGGSGALFEAGRRLIAWLLGGGH